MTLQMTTAATRAVATTSPESTEPLVADVLVIGGGPAGATAAMLLSRAGQSVILVDKAVFPRDKCCGDGLTTLALRELEPLGLTPDMVPNWQTVDAAWLCSPSGREVCVPLPDDGIYAATTPRRELDAALLDLAREAGVRIHEGSSLTSIVELTDRIEAHCSGLGTIFAGHVVAADGMWSPTRKLLGLSETGYLGEWHAFRQYARHVTGPAANRLCVWFEADLLPGYAWSFPLPDGRVNLGYGVLRGDRRTGRAMNELWLDLWSRPHIAAALGAGFELEDRHTAWPIPAGVDRAVLAHGRTLFVGDAAMATDTLTGEGIGQALLTGRLAAEALDAAVGRSADTAGADYQRAVRHHLLADHRTSAVLSRWLAHPRAARGAIRLVGLNDWTRRMFARWMFEDEPRAIAVTPSRWHRRFMRRSGAYLGLH